MNAPHPVLEPEPQETASTKESLSRLAGEVSVAIVDVSGFIDELERRTGTQLGAITTITGRAREVTEGNAQVRARLEAVAAQSEQTASAVSESVRFIQSAGKRSAEVARWVTDLADEMTDLNRTLRGVRESNEQISEISAQVNILAINAKIEAMRAGEAGRGFAVVAEAINELSQKTALAARDISGGIAALAQRFDRLSAETLGVSDEAQAVLREAGQTNDQLQEIASSVGAIRVGTEDMRGAADSVRDAMEGLAPSLGSLGTELSEISDGIAAARRRLHALIDASEGIVQETLGLPGEVQEDRFVRRVMEDAAKLGALLEAALEAGEISEVELFSDAYQPIPGSDPPQVLAPFTRLTDRLFPPVQEAALEFDDRVVFCAAVDRNGYLPTHNAKFSHPQGPDPVWNAAHCRNRRIFDDRVGLKAGRNQRGFLVQTYRRDMGGGQFALMKDVSAPIFVRGRHWGGLRLAYSV